MNDPDYTSPKALERWLQRDERGLLGPGLASAEVCAALTRALQNARRERDELRAEVGRLVALTLSEATEEADEDAHLRRRTVDLIGTLEAFVACAEHADGCCAEWCAECQVYKSWLIDRNKVLSE